MSIAIVVAKHSKTNQMVMQFTILLETLLPQCIVRCLTVHDSESVLENDPESILRIILESLSISFRLDSHFDPRFT